MKKGQSMKAEIPTKVCSWGLKNSNPQKGAREKKKIDKNRDKL